MSDQPWSQGQLTWKASRPADGKTFGDGRNSGAACWVAERRAGVPKTSAAAQREIVLCSTVGLSAGAARRCLPVVGEAVPGCSAAARISTPSTSRGPGREKKALASTAMIASTPASSGR